MRKPESRPRECHQPSIYWSPWHVTAPENNKTLQSQFLTVDFQERFHRVVLIPRVMAVFLRAHMTPREMRLMAGIRRTWWSECEDGR